MCGGIIEREGYGQGQARHQRSFRRTGVPSDERMLAATRRARCSTQESQWLLPARILPPPRRQKETNSRRSSLWLRSAKSVEDRASFSRSHSQRCACSGGLHTWSCLGSGFKWNFLGCFWLRRLAVPPNASISPSRRSFPWGKKLAGVPGGGNEPPGRGHDVRDITARRLPVRSRFMMPAPPAAPSSPQCPVRD